MKKLIITFVSVLLVFTMLAGCAQDPITPAPEVEEPVVEDPVVEEPVVEEPVVEEPVVEEPVVEDPVIEPQIPEAIFAGGWPYNTPPTGHFNMFVTNAIELRFFRELHQLPLATYMAATDEYQPMLATSWEIDEATDTFQVTLRDDALWHSGENFTAMDVWTTFSIYRLVGNPVWNFIDAVEVVSDTEVHFSIMEPTPLIMRFVLRKPMVDYETYGEFADKVQDLVDSDLDESSTEWQNLATDFSNFRPEFVNATGPYYLDPGRVTESAIELLFNENSFLADTVNFGKVVVYNGDVADLTPLVLNEEVDFLTHVFPAASMETFKAMGYDTIQVAGVDGLAIYFNHDVEPFGIQEVRQAIAHVIDRDRVGELALPGVTRGVQNITGLADVMNELWVDTTQLIDYSVNLDKATELLTSVGMYQENGEWYLEDGTQFTISLQCPATWSDAATAATEMASQLTAFGIKTTFDGIDSTLRQSNIEEGNFEMAMSFFGTGQPHPMFAYETPLLVSNLRASRGLNFPMTQETERFGTVNLEEEITASTAGWDMDAQREAIERIAGTVNETLPYLPIYTKYSNFISSRGMRTIWGADESIYMNSAGDDSFVVIQILNGDLQPIQ